MVRTESEMLALIRRAAQQDDRIRAAWLNGSRANPAAQRDALQDYDVVFSVSELAPLCKLVHWEQIFGTLAVAQEPDDSALFPGEGEDGRYAFLMQFADGVRIDLTLLAVEKAAQSFSAGGQTLLLLDKDGTLPRAPDADGPRVLDPKTGRTAFCRLLQRVLLGFAVCGKGPLAGRAALCL